MIDGNSWCVFLSISLGGADWMTDATAGCVNRLTWIIRIPSVFFCPRGYQDGVFLLSFDSFVYAPFSCLTLGYP